MFPIKIVFFRRTTFPTCVNLCVEWQPAGSNMWVGNEGGLLCIFRVVCARQE